MQSDESPLTSFKRVLQVIIERFSEIWSQSWVILCGALIEVNTSCFVLIIAWSAATVLNIRTILLFCSRCICYRLQCRVNCKVINQKKIRTTFLTAVIWLVWLQRPSMQVLYALSIHSSVWLAFIHSSLCWLAEVFPRCYLTSQSVSYRSARAPNGDLLAGAVDMLSADSSLPFHLSAVSDGSVTASGEHTAGTHTHTAGAQTHTSVINSQRGRMPKLLSQLLRNIKICTPILFTYRNYNSFTQMNTTKPGDMVLLHSLHT